DCVSISRATSAEARMLISHRRWLSRRSARRDSISLVALIVVIAFLILSSPAPLQAYVGPGAGFAVLSSFLVVFTTIVLAIVSLLAWPFRAVWRLVRGQTPPRSSIGRLIIVGFDGQDPKLTDQLMAEGVLPHFSHLAK